MAMEHPTLTPTPPVTSLPSTPVPIPTATVVVSSPTAVETVGPPPTPTSPQGVGPTTEAQEIATIENYGANRFYPDTVVVVKDVKVTLYVTRLHREHVNQFSIEPFLASTAFFPPGTMGVERFRPDRAGEFKMRNIGHEYEGNFIVADTVEDARRIISEMGVQELSLIHDLEGGVLSPSRIVVQKGLLVRVYNTTLRGEDRVSIEALYSPEGNNIAGGKITTFEFLPDVAGGFTIRYDKGAATGTLVVR